MYEINKDVIYMLLIDTRNMLFTFFSVRDKLMKWKKSMTVCRDMDTINNLFSNMPSYENVCSCMSLLSILLNLLVWEWMEGWGGFSAPLP
jgi:hypothetical protein